MATERKAIKFRLRQMKWKLMSSEEHLVISSSPSFKTGRSDYEQTSRHQISKEKSP
jgi:hypothetical protein